MAMNNINKNKNHKKKKKLVCLARNKDVGILLKKVNITTKLWLATPKNEDISYTYIEN